MHIVCYLAWTVKTTIVQLYSNYTKCNNGIIQLHMNNSGMASINWGANIHIFLSTDFKKIDFKRN